MLQNDLNYTITNINYVKHNCHKNQVLDPDFHDLFFLVEPLTILSYMDLGHKTPILIVLP